MSLTIYSSSFDEGPGFSSMVFLDPTRPGETGKPLGKIPLDFILLCYRDETGEQVFKKILLHENSPVA